MPSVSPEQQRLFGQAYAIKTGKLKPSDLNSEYRDQIVKLADSMTIKQLKDYAETKHSEMEEEEEEANENIKLKYIMKNLPTFEDFVNESYSINESMTFQEIKDKYVNNPYGIGANSVEYVESRNGWPARLIFRDETSFGRNDIEKNLKALGVSAKKLSKSTADKAYKWRFELTMFESEVNESLNEKMDTKYWADYNDDTSIQGSPKGWSDKSKDFEDTFEDAVDEWNAEAERESMIKGKQIADIRKLAMEFFKIEKWISINVIHAMIAQES